uniref:Uncharacterized protein n=1 Tax=Hanusia phi TaxID=3032 RepID=A0A7S0EYE7_9CRYP|mmetsp:Transcript_33399/g.74897  ORF Transcript_33399/g.74897 Transcript_33399/m.74897 type:complete len:240 (+) Transcript_33399:481-1200(+)|eukprot:763373-Hanusia_phi.AAC.2
MSHGLGDEGTGVGELPGAEAASRLLQELKMSSEPQQDTTSVNESNKWRDASTQNVARTRSMAIARESARPVPAGGVRSWPLRQHQEETRSCGHGTCALVGYCIRKPAKKPSAMQSERKQQKEEEAQDVPGATSLTYPIRNIHHVDEHVVKAAKDCSDATHRTGQASSGHRIETIRIRDIVIDRTPSEERKFYLRSQYFGKVDTKALTKRVCSEGEMLMEGIELARRKKRRTGVEDDASA